MSPRRMAAIVRKELLHIARDPRNLFLVTGSPAFLLFLLSYVFSIEVGQLNLAIVDLDRSTLSRRYVATLTSDQDLFAAYHPNDYKEALLLLVRGDADVALVIPIGFEDTVHRRQRATVQAIIDGTDPFVGRQAAASLAARSTVFSAGTGVAGPNQGGQLVEVRTQVRYNAGLDPLYSMVPGLMAIVLVMPPLALALALTREKESGTLEGLVATPITGMEYLGGKLLAYMVAALFSTVLAMLVAVVWFGVPFRGSLPLFLLLTAVYLLACMGAAVVIANFARSQQTAMFIVLLVFLVPSFFLAGLITPIPTDSLGSLFTSYALPTTHFVQISRALFLKGLSAVQVLLPTLILLGMGLGAVGIGLLLFRRKVQIHRM